MGCSKLASTSKVWKQNHELHFIIISQTKTKTGAHIFPRMTGTHSVSITGNMKYEICNIMQSKSKIPIPTIMKNQVPIQILHAVFTTKGDHIASLPAYTKNDFYFMNYTTK
jgi:hypothetical protein